MGPACGVQLTIGPEEAEEMALEERLGPGHGSSPSLVEVPVCGPVEQTKTSFGAAVGW